MAGEHIEKYRNNAFTAEEIEKEWVVDPSITREGIYYAFDNARKLWQAGAPWAAAPAPKDFSRVW
ncbi:MAG: hypothetical protein SWK76_07550 [Actinomycetota bacterium]|nr:hypothetical protein [Actinomycetota bacterium]